MKLPLEKLKNPNSYFVAEVMKVSGTVSIRKHKAAMPLFSSRTKDFRKSSFDILLNVRIVQQFNF